MITKRRNRWLVLVDVLLIAVTICCAIALFVALIARWISPTWSTIFAFFALGAPLLFLANFFTFALWIARWRAWAVLPGLVLLFGVWNVGDFYQMNWTKERHQTRPTHTISVLTYNVHNFKLVNSNSNSTVAPVCSQIKAIGADVVLLQEYSIADSTELARFEELMVDYPYRAYQYDVSGAVSNHRGQAIFSQHPLSSPRTLNFEGTDNSVLMVDLYHPVDTLRLFGCHLQTTSFNTVSRERGLRSVVESEKSDSLAKTAIAALSHNFRVRSVQADTLAELIHTSLFPVVVAGDFNSPPLTYTYHTVLGDLSDAFCEVGVGYGYTYKPIKGLFRIDYVLFDGEGFEAIDYSSPDLPFSDHNPVVVRLKKR